MFMLLFPEDFDDFAAWEVECKGFYSGARVRVGNDEFPVTFYDPVRLMQDLEKVCRYDCFAVGRLIVVTRLTRGAMDEAVSNLSDDFFA